MESIEIPDTGQAPLLVIANHHVPLNKHLCINCDGMVQRFAYAKYLSKYILPYNGWGQTRMHWVTDKRTTPVYLLQPNFNAVFMSANHGCHLCSLFVNQFRIERRGLPDLAKLPDTSQCLVGLLFNKTPKVEGALYDLQMVFTILSTKENINIKLQVRPIEGQKIPIVGVPQGLEFPLINLRTCTYTPTAQDQERSHRLRAIYGWLEDCLERHEKCQSVSEAAAERSDLPARLIHVGSAGDFSDLRLVEVLPDQPRPRWITLSHSWGPKGSINLKLSQSNIEGLKAKISFESLTENFKDAVVTARNLGERFGTLFLWIDALCIIQDSVSDWATESIKMGSIYSNSFCTFFACRGVDPSAGLWDTPDTLSRHECCIEGGPNSCLRGRWQIRDVDAFKNGVQNSKLCSRAWAHQESNLATRRLYFAPGQVFWGCYQGVKQEMDPGSVLLEASTTAETGGLSMLAIQCDRDSTRQQKLDKSYSIWLEIATQHSVRDITYATDRLPSLAAIAKVMLDWIEYPDDYIAGTWKSFFWACILWQIRSPDKVSKAQNGSPSWSWTSVAGAVHFLIRPAYIVGINRKLESFFPEIWCDEYCSQPAQPEFAMGALLEASVKVRGRVLRLKMHVRVARDREIPLLAKFQRHGQDLSTVLPVSLDFMSDWKETGYFDVFALIVARDSDYAVTKAPTRERLFCIILRKDEKPGPVYSRCGLFEIADFRPETPWGKVLEEQARTVELDSETEYHESHGNGVYTLTLA